MVRWKALSLAAALILSVVLPADAQVPPGWEKVSGMPEAEEYSGSPDGLAPAGDRQNSYAWSMDVLGDHLYVGTNRNVFSLMVQQVPWGSSLIDFTNSGMKPVPLPTDMRGRIHRMSLADDTWELVYTPPPFPGVVPLQGLDSGYRMMKTFKACGRPPVRYVGGGGFGVCRLLALDGVRAPREIFRTELPNQFLSIRAIAEHDGKLF